MKKLWKENRVLLMLFIVLFVCFIAILSVCLTFFYNRNVTEYGNRLDGIENYPITTKFKESFENKVLENEHVEKVKITIKGRMIYLHIDFDSEIALEEAQNVATASLENFSEKYLGFYDINYVLVSDNFTMLGAKTTKIDYISWNNNRDFETDEEEEEE